jgi:hypothetical protein
MQKETTMITNEMTNEAITRNASTLVDIAMLEADVWGRKFYRGLVKVSRVDDERQDALRRLRSSRSAIVRASVNQLVRHEGSYRWFRYLTQAPMIHIELVARHSSISREVLA